MASYNDVMKNYFDTPEFLQELMDNAGRSISEENYQLLDDTDFEQDWLDIKFDETVKNSYLFYVENPPVAQVGYYDQQKIFAIKANPYVLRYAKTDEDKVLFEQADEFNEIDGDTIKFDIDTITDYNTGFELAGKTYNCFSDFAKDCSPSSLKMRLLGINTPEVIHYAAAPVKSETAGEYVTIKKFKNIKHNDNYVLENYDRDDEEEITFFSASTNYYEVVDKKKYITNEPGDITLYKIVVANDTKNQTEAYKEEGMKAKKLVFDLLNRAQDIMVIVDHKALSRKPSTLPAPYNYDAIYNENNTLKKGIMFLQKKWEELFSHRRYKYMGFNAPGIESNGRFLGAVYVKVSEDKLGTTYDGAPKMVWVNVAKYVLYHCRDFTEALPNYTNNPKEEYHNTFVSDAFKLYSYDIEGMEIIDKFTGYTDKFIEERNSLYKQITGYDVNKLKEFTFILGDCILLVPPISIKSTTQTAHEKIPLLRAKGSAVKSSPKSLKLVEVELYFNEDTGINGMPVTQPLNNTGKQTVYYMNGLRSIVAMFKLTPFLPIENDYVNNILGIDAVSLFNIQVTTVPNYPKTLKATLTLQEFNYHIYMPELEMNTSSNTNTFSRTIHYPAFRWYYQRLLQKGNEIKDYTFNSDDYIKETYGNKTALIPMSFTDPTLEFYVPDEGQLQRRLEVLMSAYPVVTQEQLTSNIKEGMKDCLSILNQIDTVNDIPDIKNSFDNLIKKDVLTFNKEVYASSIEYTTSKNTKTATVFPIIFGYTAEKTTVWPESGTQKWQKVIFQFDNEGKVMLPRIAPLTAPHENHSANLMNKLCRDLSYHFSGYGDVEVQETVDKSETNPIYTLRVLVPLPAKLRNSTYETNILLRKIATDLGDDKQYLTYNSQGTLCVPLDWVMDIEKYEKGSTKIDTFIYKPASNLVFDYGGNGLYFLNYVKKMVEDVDPDKIGDEASRLQQELYEEMNDTFLNQDLKLKFNKYDLDDITVESLRFSYSNTFSRMHLKAMDGYAFQYCGGQDMAIEVTILTQDEMAVAMLVDLPRFSAYYARHYRLALNCWPLRMNSEFTRLFGINEVVVENVITETIENQPGVTRVTLKLFSVDRTTRSREALKKIDIDTTLGSNATGQKGRRNIRDMFYIRDALAQAELYPDLQLPTITELEKAGFKLYKHSQIEEYIPQRTYVDPDFYFIYGHVLSCEVHKKSVMDALKKVNTISYQESDIYGALSTIYTPEIIEGKKDADTSNKNVKNDAKYFQEEDKTIYQTHKLENDLAYAEETAFSLQSEGTFDYVTLQKEINNNISDVYKMQYILPETLAQLNTPFWNISNEVKIAFKENQFKLLSNANDTIVGQTMNELKAQKLEQIDKFLDETPSAIMKNMGQKVTLKKGDFDTYKTLTEHTENRIKDTIKQVFKNTTYKPIFNVFSICAEVNSDPINEIKDVICNSFLAAADAHTGEMYYNSSFYTNVVDRDSAAKASQYNWKAKAFLSYGKSVTGDGEDKIKDHAIPYCRVKKQNGAEVFASNLSDALNNGYSYGVFQLKRYPKSFVEKLTGDMRLKKGHTYFLNPTLRNFQVKERYDLMFQEIENILLDPGYAAIAYMQEILVLYRYYLKKDVIFSIYEIARLQADSQQYKIDTNQQLASKNTYTYTPDETLEKIQKQTFEQFYELISIVATLQGYDSEKREYLCSTVLKLKADEDALKSAIKKEVKDPETKITEFVNNAKTKSEDASLSDEERARWTTLYNAGNLKPDIVSLSYQVRELIASYKAKVAINSNAYGTVVQMIQEDELKMAAGRVVSMSMLLMDYDNLSEPFETKNTNELDRIISTASAPSVNSEYALYRKYIYALMGRKVIDTASGSFPIQTADSVLRNIINEYVNVWKSNSPIHYMKDSYFDMIQNDKRGRMVRAFPTYYLLFIDEGRDIGLWHLHDNFYGMNAIAEIEVTKSRKIAADTAHIVMTNIFKNYLTNDQDTIYNMDFKSLNEIMYTIQDVYSSIFSPRSYAEKEELQRQNTLVDLKANISSGARMHLRMGYGSNASTLPTVFNGTVAEINSGEVVEIVAQGDGVELNNPLEEDNIEDVEFQKNFIATKMFEGWWNNGVTPKTLLSSLLATKGNWLQNTIRSITKGRFFNTNPYGIVHFGDPEYTQIFSNSECTQNIFEAYNEAIYVSGTEVRGLEPKYRTSDIPKIAVHANGKTFWDLMHICASTCPDYICSIIPFDMRSSIFLGAGRYYAAYTYIREKNNVSGDTIVKEKRKPFQQYHFYSSFTDIIENHITASSKDVRTNAIGHYSETRWFGNEATQKVGPLYVDYD